MADLSADELQLAFHEVECETYDERFGISYDEHTARAAARETERLLGTGHLGRVLDVGCGTGYLGLGLASVGRLDELHLVDLSPGMLGRARENAAALGVDATFVRATAAELPFRDDRFDAVVTRGVLHHLADPVPALREWRRVVRPGGPVLALSEPSPHADTIGGWAARSALHGLRVARRLTAALGRPLSSHDDEAQQLHDYWDLVAMAANIHTFRPTDLERLGREAGFASTTVRGCGLISIMWAAGYYTVAGQVPGIAGSARSKRLASSAWQGLRRLDQSVVERLVADDCLLTVQAVYR